MLEFRPLATFPVNSASRVRRPVKKSSVRAVFRSLNREGVKFLVVGGLAVNVHGVLRFTADIDLVVRLESGNIRRAFSALEKIGYRPSVGVTAERFSDKATRETWIRDKGMKVLSFWSDAHRETGVDLFVQEPFAFEREYAVAVSRDMKPGGVVRFVSLRTLIRMKKQAARPKDLADLEELKRVSRGS